MNQSHDKTLYDDRLCRVFESIGKLAAKSVQQEIIRISQQEPEVKTTQEPDWLDTSKACNLDDPECEACQ